MLLLLALFLLTPFMAFKITTINVRSVRTVTRAQSVLSFLERFNSDVFLLQECGLPFLSSYRKWEDKWQHGPSIWSGSNFNKNDGVAILIKTPQVVVKGSTVVVGGRALLANCTFMGRDFNVLNVYGFNDKHDRCTLLEDLQSHMLGRDPLVVGGDFNCVLSRADRRGAGGDFKVDRSSVLLQGLCRDFKLTDCFKTLHPREEGFTWTSGDGTRASRIDYLFTRDCPPTDARITPAFFSDHVMLTCTLSLSSGVTVGRGPWKLNCSLLEDDKVVSQYREQFSQWQTLQDFFDTRAQWWEMVKGRTRTFFREIGKKKSKEKDRCMVGLQKRLERYFNLCQQGLDFNQEIKEVKKEMAFLAEQRSKGVILRSKERELEEGEKCTRYFLKKIVSKGRLMTRLKNKDGVLKTDTEGIKEVVEDFYGELFGVKDVCEETMGDLLTYIDKTLPKTDDLTKDLTRTEIEQGLKHFKRGKSPGEDGLPLEFYLTFWDVLADELLTVFTDFEHLDRLPDSFRVGIVTLLYKKNDRTDLKNWRPITLLNFDCKLFTKVLTLRMSSVLGEVIHPDQTCAVPGRKITDSLILIRDAICYARDRNMRLVVLNLDFEKAFDRVSHQYLFKVLQKMGFPDRFLAWVGLLYGDITSKILVNGHLSKAVGVHCGVRQGCPLSPLLFVACIEPLAQVLRRDQGISGVGIPGSGGMTAKCVFYMDDVNILCTDLLSVDRTLDRTDWYGRASGARLNRDKTEAQFFGPWADPDLTRLPLTVKLTDIRVLGVKFDRGGGGSGNWSGILGTVRQRLGFWGLRQLTLEGKVLIIKAVILPVLLLISSVFIPPRRSILDLERMLFYFLWGGKWERLRREVVKRPRSKGGKGLPDLYLFLGSRYTALHLTLATSPVNNKTQALARFWLGSYLRTLRLIPVDLRAPVSFLLPPPYVQLQKFLRHFKLEKETVTVLTKHSSLLSLVQEREPVCPVRGLATGEPTTVWRNVAHPALLNRHRDLSWMVAHEILPVRAVMHSRGMARTSACPRTGCGQEESVRHMLWECRAARDLWKEAGPLITSCLPAGEDLTPQLVLYGVGRRPISSKTFTKLWPTLTCLKEALWSSRNLLVAKNVETTPQAVAMVATEALGWYERKGASTPGEGSPTTP
uniref:Reverse transcriptase domain-containing protein n=1 Tax=Oncorhynchus kisutch TaxID=8019 RepID=A0A8C7IU91_ONCKI